MTEPRSWLTYPRQFGHVEHPEWQPGKASQRAELVAAQQQHELARQVREQKFVHELTDADLARTLGVDAETIGRYLRGTTPIPLDKMNHLAHAAGLVLTLTIARTGA